MSNGELQAAEVVGVGTDASVIAELAEQADTEARVAIDEGEIYLVRGERGELHVIDTDQYAAAPRHTTASRVVTDAASFVAYVNRHKIPGTEIYAHTNTSTVVAVIDSHEGTDSLPGWQKHTLRLTLEKSKPWLAWERVDGKYLEQEDFANFLDDQWSDVIDPAPAVLVDIATTFHAKTNVDFAGAVRLDSGDVKLSFEEKTTAKAGQKGDIEIPKKIQLALRPYVGGPIYSIWAHFRYRLRGGQVLLGFKLERPENVLDAAFADIVTEIREGRTDKDVQVHAGVGEVPIFNGKQSA
jgi:uncharacterized protein YfdQ (DUF2303 family)